MTNLIANPSATQSLQDLLNSIKEIKPDPIKFDDDPVAMAFASYRSWKENHSSRWIELGSVPVTETDRINAQELRAYYGKNMTWQALKTNNVSNSTFRQKLAAIVSDTHVYTKEDIGLLHRLPYFYYEDLALDRVFAATKNPVKVEFNRASLEVISLIPVEQVLRSRRSGDYIQFYWKDSDDHLYLLVVKQDNPLISIIESLFRQSQIKINAMAYPKHARGYHQDRMFFQLGSIELVV